MTTLLETAYKAIDDKKGEDIVVLNMEGVSLIADQFIICMRIQDAKYKQLRKKLPTKLLKQDSVLEE